MRVCIFQFSALTVNRKYYCSHRTQKNSLHLRAGLATGICSWIFPPLPLTPVPQYRYFYWVLWMQNCADIWVESKCLRGKIHSIISCSNTSFSVPIWKLWALLQPAPFDRRTQQMSAGMVVVFPVMLLYPESELCTLLPDPWPAGLAGDIGRDWYNSAVGTVTRTTETCCNILWGEADYLLCHRKCDMFLPCGSLLCWMMPISYSFIISRKRSVSESSKNLYVLLGE